mmetsp:Transcript_19052/g.28801  ORF Transcript_19052/g.28801 Transcript_19052/m.28801 type:complete len:125 (-) Transcript_19052:1582-1956(-)
MAEFKKLGQLGGSVVAAAGRRRTWGEWVRDSQGPLINIGIGFFGCLLSSQILQMKYAKNDLELELAAVRAELNELRAKINAVEPVATKLKVDPNKLRTELNEFLSSPNVSSLQSKNTIPQRKFI